MKVLATFVLGIFLSAGCKATGHSTLRDEGARPSASSSVGGKTFVGADAGSTISISFGAEDDYVKWLIDGSVKPGGALSYQDASGEVSIIETGASNIRSYVAQFTLSSDGRVLTQTVPERGLILTLQGEDISLVGRTYEGGGITASFRADGDMEWLRDGANVGLHYYRQADGKVTILNNGPLNILAVVAQFDISSDGRSLRQASGAGGLLLRLKDSGGASLIGKSYSNGQTSERITFHEGGWLVWLKSGESDRSFTYEQSGSQINVIELAANNIRSHVAQFTVSSDGRTLTQTMPATNAVFSRD